MKILKTIWKFTKSFLLFWKDFLVGDSPELALGVIIILGVAYWLHNLGIWDVVAITALALILMIITVWRKTRDHS
jgi:membrane protein YdbS with pleckstrin-like domain